jgi:hypothetical protein
MAEQLEVVEEQRKDKNRRGRAAIKAAGLGPSEKMRSGSHWRETKPSEAELDAETPSNDVVKARLRREANRALAMSCRSIAHALMNKACTGDARCMQLLYMLAEQKAASTDEARKQRVRELMDALGNEPEWDGSRTKAAEAMFGGGAAAPE